MERPDNHDPLLDELVEDESSPGDEAEAGELPQQGERRVFTDKSDPPIGALQMRYQSGDLVLQPLFQRRKVWDDSRASRLIESVVLEVPLPVFYFAEGPDGADEVIDGQQRLRAFFRFLNNEYALRGLNALPQLNGKMFRDLDKSLQRLVRDSSIRTITFKKESVSRNGGRS